MNLKILKEIVSEIVDANSLTLGELLNFYTDSLKRKEIRLVSGNFNHTEIERNRDDIPSEWRQSVENRKATIYLVKDFKNDELLHEVGHAILGLEMTTRDINNLGWYLYDICDRSHKLDRESSMALTLVDPRLEDIVHMLGMSDTYEWSGHDYEPEYCDEIMHEVFANWFTLMYDWQNNNLDDVTKNVMREVIKGLDPNQEVWTILRHLCRIKIS